MVSYDERLFSGGLRKKVHEARFYWLAKKLEEYVSSDELNVVELGCFNGRSLNYIPANFAKYHGLDSNWEGGLDQAKSMYFDKRISFEYCVDAFGLEFDQNTNVFVCLETLEHLVPKTLEGYIDKLAKTLPSGTSIFITVPNEVGLSFVAKRILKLVFFKDHVASEYSWMEFMFQALGMTEKIEKGHGHKGFHWKKLLNRLMRDFEVLSIEGVQAPMLPTFLNPSVGLVLKKADATGVRRFD